MSPEPADTAALERVLGQQPPASTATLDQAVVDDLVAMVSQAHDRQEEEMTRAIDHALRLVPWPLKKVVKKVILP